MAMWYSDVSAIENHLPTRRECKTIYMDLYVSENNVDLGIFSEQLQNEIAHKIPDHCSILQAEIAAIWKPVNIYSIT